MQYICGSHWTGFPELGREKCCSSKDEEGHSKEVLLLNVRLLFILLQLSLKQETPLKQTIKTGNCKTT